MRRSDREVTDKNEILNIIKNCDVCRLGLNDGEVPYILPMNFGIKEETDGFVLIFHSATEGKKVELLRNNKKVFFEMDRGHELEYDKDKGYCTMMYESVMGIGDVFFFDGVDVPGALQILMDKYHPEISGHTFYNQSAIPRTLVYGVRVSFSNVSAKRKSR